MQQLQHLLQWNMIQQLQRLPTQPSTRSGRKVHLSTRFSPNRAHTLGDKPKKRQARTRWRQVNTAGQGGS
ncbi:hypothetical protein TNCV_837491 [Trichonephila clavipes]|nr:hypothetical protein TNCV_837491 [Trichonephila clavipes]